MSTISVSEKPVHEKILNNKKSDKVSLIDRLFKTMAEKKYVGVWEKKLDAFMNREIGTEEILDTMQDRVRQLERQDRYKDAIVLLRNVVKDAESVQDNRVVAKALVSIWAVERKNGHDIGLVGPAEPGACDMGKRAEDDQG